MFGTRRKAAEQQLVKLEHQLDLIYTALIVRDPGTAKSAEAYEGLRKQVIASATARHAHAAQLAEFDVALRRGASTEDLLKLTSQWLDQSGVARIDDATHREAFETTVAPGVPVEVEIPAYFITATGQLVRQGRLREREHPVVAEPRANEQNAAHVPESAATVAVDEQVNEDAAQVESVADATADAVAEATQPAPGKAPDDVAMTEEKEAL